MSSFCLHAGMILELNACHIAGNFVISTSMILINNFNNEGSVDVEKRKIDI